MLATKYTFNPAMMGGSGSKTNPNGGGNHRKHMHVAVEASLKRLNTDYIDLYWTHAFDGRTPVEETMRALDDLVKQGKILYVGVSDYPAWKVAEANTLATLRGWTPWVALQIEYSLVERTPERDLLPMARDFGMGVTPWSPLAQGALTGKYLDNKDDDDDARLSGKADSKYRSDRADAAARACVEVAKDKGDVSPSQVAVAWLLHQPGVTRRSSARGRSKHINDNLDAVSVDLSGDDLARLDKATKIDLGFPHEFLQGADKNITGETTIDAPHGRLVLGSNRR